VASANESGRSWQIEADLLADGRVLLERLCDRIRTRHLYPAGPNLALLLEAYQILHRERTVGRVASRPRPLRRRMRKLLRQLVRRDVALRSLRLTYKFPPARPQPLDVPLPPLVERALQRIDGDARLEVKAHLQGLRRDDPDVAGTSLHERSDARLGRGLSQLRDALINEALAHPAEIPGLHAQYLASCVAGLPLRVQHPLARFLLVKLPLYLWLGFIGLFAVAYVGAYFFLNDETLGRLLTRVIGKQINGDLELGSVHWSPRLLLDLVTGRPHHVVVRDVKIWRGYKREGTEPDKLIGWADEVEASLVLHEIIPWNRLVVPPVFEIPWVLHFTRAEVLSELHIDVGEFAIRNPDGRITWGISLLDTFAPNPAAPTAPPETRGLSFRIDDARLHDTALDLDFRPQSGWQTALHLTDASFSLFFEGLHPQRPPPPKKPLVFDLKATADTGVLRILSLGYELPITDLELDQFAAGGSVPLGDLRIRGTGSFAGSSGHIDGWMRDAFSANARNVDLTVLFDDAGAIARTIGEAHKLPPTMLSAEGAPAQLTFKGPLQDVTIGLAGSGLALDFFTDPDDPEPAQVDWSLKAVDLRLSMNKDPLPAMWGTRYHRPDRERWVVDFARLEGEALGGTLRMREHEGRNHLVIGEPGEPLVVSMLTDFSALDPGELFPPGDNRARLGGKAEGVLGLRELVMRLGGGPEDDVDPSLTPPAEDFDETPAPTPAPIELATPDRDLSPAPDPDRNPLRRVVLDLADIELERHRGPAEDGLPRRLRAAGTIVLDEETGLDLSDFNLDVNGGGLRIAGGLDKALTHFKPTDLRLKISDGPAFLRDFGQGPYFQRLTAGLTLSGPVARPNGTNGSLTVSDVGSGKFALTDISEVRLWMDRGVLSLRSPKIGLLGGAGKLDADLDFFADDPRVRASLDLDDVDLGQLGNDSIRGRGDIRIEVSDQAGRAVPLSKVQARGALFVPRLQLGQGEFRDAEARFSLDREALHVDRLVVHHHRKISPSFAPEVTVPAGELRARGDISFASDPGLALEVSAAGLPISAFAAIAGLGELPAGAQIAEGTRLDVTGTLARPGVHGVVALKAIHAAGVPLGTGTLDLDSRDLPASDGLAARREIKVRGSFGDDGSRTRPAFDWDLDAVVAFGPVARRARTAPMSADVAVRFASLPLINLLRAAGLEPKDIHGQLEGLTLRAQSCSPELPLLSSCLWDSDVNRAIQVLVEVDRLWAATKPPATGVTPGSGQTGDPCRGKDSLCSQNRLVGALEGTRLRLRDGWELRTGGSEGGATLTLSGDLELSPSPASAADEAPKDAAASMTQTAARPPRKRCDEPSDRARVPPPGSGHAEVRGELLLGALAPFVRGFGLGDLSGTLGINLDIDGHIGDPILSGTFNVPAGAPPLHLAAADRSWALDVPRLELGWARDTLSAAGELRFGGQTLRFGEVAGHHTYYTLGGPCAGNFSAAAQGFLDARPLRDLVPDAFTSTSGGLDVRQAHITGLVDDPLEIFTLRASLSPGQQGLGLQPNGLGIDAVDLGDGNIDILRCGPTNLCPYKQDGYAIYLGGVTNTTADKPPGTALRARIGDRGRATLWGHAVLSPDFSRITASNLRADIDELAYRMYDNSGRPQLYATVGTDNLVLEGRDSMALRGELLVSRGRWVRDAQEGVRVLSFADPTTAPAKPPPELIRDLALDLRIRTTAPFQVNNNVMKGVEGQVLLAVGGTLGDLEMSGKIDVSTGVLDVAILNGAYDVQYGKVQLERSLEASTVDVLALRQEPVYVDNQPRQMYVKLGGTLEAITWRCIVQGDTSTRSRTTRECVDYLVLGAGDRQVADSNVRRYGGGGLLGRPIGLVGNLTELKLGRYVEKNAPRLAPYVPDVALRAGQLGIEVNAETPRPWFRSDWGNLTVGAGYTRGYPGLLLRNSYDWRVRFRLLDSATLEFRDNRRSYFNERIIFDPLRQRSLELRLDYQLPSLR
jgi:hypothetical protein